MNPSTDPDTNLTDRYLRSELSPEELSEFEGRLRTSEAARAGFRRALRLDTNLRNVAAQPTEALAWSAPEAATRPAAPAPAWAGWLAWLSPRPLTVAAVGLVIGLFSASVVFAYASPRAVATAERLFALVDGSFENGAAMAGFPKLAGVWSGDASESIVGENVKAREGRRMLRFVKAEGDANSPDGRAVACDVFQLVDLRPQRANFGAEGNSVLELSANFLDARPADTGLSVTFFCQIFLFKGEPDSLHQTWPNNISEAIAFGSAHVTTLGGKVGDWTHLTAKSLVTAEADFTVVQISARPNRRVPMPPQLFADDVKLTLKTQPALPVRVVQR
ncbi:MAG: hypothetical protein RL514_1953 [Verrucomicrobiota bacterium]|jgi:hypothetical protein